MTPRDRLIVALDVPEADAARALVDRLAGRVGMFKIGSQLFTAAGPDLVREIVARGREGLPRPQVPRHPEHRGRRGRERVAPGRLARRRPRPRRAGDDRGGGRARCPPWGRASSPSPSSPATTTETLDEIGVNGSVVDSVRRLAQLAKEAGADGVVASPHEVEPIREACGRDFLIVTPGIRPAGAARDDQARLATPGRGARRGRRLPRGGPAHHRGRRPGRRRRRDRARDGDALRP